MAKQTITTKTSQRFAEMLQRAERSEVFQIEGIKVEIAEQICLAMERQQVTKADLARRLGKSPAYVTKALQGSTNFTLESLVRIARALACQIQLALKPTSSANPVQRRVGKLAPPVVRASTRTPSQTRSKAKIQRTA